MDRDLFALLPTETLDPLFFSITRCARLDSLASSLLSAENIKIKSGLLLEERLARYAVPFPTPGSR